jgi:hypothetical protein
MKDLLWELFLMVRELENRVGEPGPTPEHTRRQSEWAARFHELEVNHVAAAPEPVTAAAPQKRKR